MPFSQARHRFKSYVTHNAEGVSLPLSRTRILGQDVLIVIQSFAYRVPRIDFCLPVEFLVGPAVLFGHTRNISVKGFLVEFDEPVAEGTVGRIRFRIGRCTLELDTRVAHSQGFAAGMEFSFASEHERFGLVTILQVITNEQISRRTSE